jgi:hypothetical protein
MLCVFLFVRLYANVNAIVNADLLSELRGIVNFAPEHLPLEIAFMEAILKKVCASKFGLLCSREINRCATVSRSVSSGVFRYELSSNDAESCLDVAIAATFRSERR